MASSEIILHLLPVLTRGGAELQLCHLAEAQSRAGHCVTVACLRISEELRTRLTDAEVSLVVSRDLGVRFPIELIRTARRSRVVHAWMYHAFVLAVVLRPWTSAPHVWAVRRTDPDSPGLSRRTRAVVALTRRWSRTRTDGIIYCSEAAQTAHERFGFDPPASAVVPNAIRVPPTRPRPSGPVRRFGVLGRWSADKGIDVLLDAWQQVRTAGASATLTLAGPGLEDDNSGLVDALVERGLDGHIETVGPTFDPVAFLGGLDCLVSPSRSEGFPNVVAEAMALGVPVIATDVGGTAEVLGDCGQLVRPDSPAELAGALLEFARHPESLQARAADGPARAAGFSVERVLDSTHRFYDKVRQHDMS